MITDPTALRTRGYATAAPLSARMAIYRWQREPIDLPEVALAALATARGNVLDAGCGTGAYADRIRAQREDLAVVPLDLSLGMAPEVVGDVQRLPFRDNAFGAVLAMHMLYHVPDIQRAVAEFRRVLGPDGVLVVSTNGPEDKREFPRLLADALSEVSRTDVAPDHRFDRFTHLDAGLLRAEFAKVAVEVFERSTVVPEIEPVVAYVDSMRALSTLPPDTVWAEVLDVVRSRVTATIEAEGAWTFRGQVAVLTCR